MLKRLTPNRSDRTILPFLLFALILPGVVSPGAAPAQDATSDTGRSLFEAKCAACHSLGSDRVVGPGLEGVTRRRERGWLLRMITDPASMIDGGDSIATRLYAEYGVPMPNLGVSASEAGAIVAFLEARGGGVAGEAVAREAAAGEAAAGGAPAGAVKEAAPSPAGDAAVGRALFTGERRLTGGGPACISCHSVGGEDVRWGGTLARDLSQAAANYGAGLRSVLRTTPFPVMREVFAERPLSEQEIADLAAFLEEAGQAGAAERAGMSGADLAYPLLGLAGAAVLVLLAGWIWRRRLNGVRKALIGGGR